MDELRRIWALAWPVAIGQLAMVGMGVVDMLVVGAHGPVALSALGIGHSFSYALLVLGLGTAMGIDPLVAQAFGRGAPREAVGATTLGAVVVGGLAIPITALHLCAEPVLRALSQPADAIPGAASYAAILAAGVVPMLGFALVRQLLQGGGDMRTATAVILVANALNLALDLWLVNGLGLGIAGAAWATVAVRWAMFAAMLLAARRYARETVASPFELAAVARVAGIAVPVGWQLGLEVWAFVAATMLAGALGTLASAAHNAALNATSVAFMVPLGVSAAAATRVGNLVGAGADWRRAGWTAVGLGAAVMTVSGALFVATPATIGALYNADPEVVALVAGILPIAAAFGFFDGVQVAAFGVLRGLGDTERPAWANLVGYWLIGLPLGAWLGLRGGWGLAGVWIGLSVGLGLVAALLVARLGWWSRISPAPAGGRSAPDGHDRAA